MDMKKLSHFSIVASLLLTALMTSCSGSGKQEPFTMKITGSGADVFPDSSYVAVYHVGDDIRFVQPAAHGILQNGEFCIDLTDSLTRPYDLLFLEDLEDGTFSFVHFLSEKKPVHFTFRADSEDSEGVVLAKVKGGKENTEYQIYTERVLKANKECSAKLADVDLAVDSLAEKMSSMIPEGFFDREDFDYSEIPGFDELNAEFTSMLDKRNLRYRELMSDYNEWEKKRLRTHKTVAGLLVLTDEIERQISDNKYRGYAVDTEYFDIYKEYRVLFPENEMVRRTDGILEAFNAVAPGKPFKDFTAPALDGSRYRLSELISGKIAVLNCWASWCRPCRAHSKELMPIYEKYKDKGFTVVSIACEYGSLDDMKHAIELDGYTWLPLYDLDNVEGVWELYGLSGGGGGIFLIDADGLIVEKVSEISSVEAYLQENL